MTLHQFRLSIYGSSSAIYVFPSICLCLAHVYAYCWTQWNWYIVSVLILSSAQKYQGTFTRTWLLRPLLKVGSIFDKKLSGHVTLCWRTFEDAVCIVVDRKPQNTLSHYARESACPVSCVCDVSLGAVVLDKILQFCAYNYFLRMKSRLPTLQGTQGVTRDAWHNRL